ncbi:MAG TPA: Arc family DNA-binding protein [Thermodesulfobacteriota bacterium]
MPVNLSIKNVPDVVAEKLRKRAAKHHRSLQGELMAILEESLADRKVLTPGELLSEVQAMGLKTPDESVIFIRKERDARSRR